MANIDQPLYLFILVSTYSLHLNKGKRLNRFPKREILKNRIESLETRIDKSLTSLEDTIKDIKEDLMSETKRLMDVQAQSHTKALAMGLLDRLEYQEKEEKGK